MSAKHDLHDKRDVVVQLVALKERAMRLGLYRTGRLLDIPQQEIGWEIQGADTPAWQKARQQATLTP